MEEIVALLTRIAVALEQIAALDAAWIEWQTTSLVQAAIKQQQSNSPLDESSPLVSDDPDEHDIDED
jgi:hypothetical protein